MKSITLLLLTLILVSCGSSKTITNTAPNGLFEILSQQDNGGASIRFFEILSQPNEIAMLQYDDKLKHKINTNDIQNSNFVILNLGEKTSKGYSINVESVVETEKNIIVTLKEISPKENTTSTQEITTPYSILKINSKKEIIFKD